MEVRTEIIKVSFATDVALHIQTMINGDKQNAAFTLPAFYNLTSIAEDLVVTLATECKKTQPTNINIDFSLPFSLEEDRISTIQIRGNARTISSESAEATLREHLQHCTVGISVEGIGGFSGFFIGPKQVLTTQDIVDYVQDTKPTLTVQWDGKSYPVQFIVDMPNLEVLLLYVNIENHPCLSLNASVEASDYLYSFKYSEDFTGNTIYQCRGMAQQNRYLGIELRPEQTKMGVMSGAPLLNLRTGGVCGMVMHIGANQWGIPMQTIIEELSKHSYRLPQPENASHYNQQQFERDITSYVTHVERELRFLKIFSSVSLTSPNAIDPELGGIYVQPLVDVGGKTTTVADLLDTHPHAVVLGGPGSGKTTLVCYLAWSQALAYSETSSTSPPPFLQETLIPLRIGLSLFALERRKHNYDFLSFADEVLLKREGVNIDRRMFEQLLERKSMLLLFDGLDEVATLDERRRLVEEIEQLEFRYPGNRVLVTTRPVGYDLARFSSATFTHAQLLPFDELQINQYLVKWYQYTLKLSTLPQREQQELDSLIEVLRSNKQLRYLAENPLLLTLIAQLHRYERLPDRRVLIYDRCADQMLETWSKIKVTNTRWKDMKMVKDDQYACIAHLGFYIHQLSEPKPRENEDVDMAVECITARVMMREIERFLKERDLITEVAEQRVEAMRFSALIQVEAGLIVEQGTDENGESLYSFVHRTFQEYFATADVYERYMQEGSLDIVRNFLSENLYDPHWSEVIFLLFDKLKRRPLTRILQEILSGLIRSHHRLNDDDMPDKLLFVNSCLCDELAVDDTLAEEVVGELGNLAINATSLSQYEQAMKMLTAIAETRLYGELGRKKLEEIDLRRRQEQFQDVEPSTQQPVQIHRYYASLTVPTHTTQIGQTVSLTLHIQSTQRDNSEPLLLPVNALELGVYLEAPGFYLEGDHLRGLLVVDGRPADTTLQIQCKPVLSGKQTLRVLLYPGGQAQGLTPTVLTQSITVLIPIVLPPIPELLDQRTIPDPHPDMVLVIALEDLRDTQRLQVYCSCPALRMERVALGPLPLSMADIACLRQAVIHYACTTCSLAPDEVQKSLQQLGATLFDQLMPPDHELRATYWKLRNLATSSPTPLTWLIIADEFALLPWELVCPYDRQATSSEIDYDDFLADSFLLSHWVARQGLPIQAEAPLGWTALDHYRQYLYRLPRWHTVLADETLNEVEQPEAVPPGEGYVALQQPGLPYYGLHVLRYYDLNRGTRITAQERQLGEAMPSRSDAERMTYERRLDFTRKRPVIGLSLVEEDALQLDTRVSQHDTQLEAGWFLPFMHAGASALVGARWSMLPEVDQTFFRAFYQAIRAGTPIGWAVGAARAQVKQSFPWRADWLAYTYFGHPWCTLYQVQPSQGFTMFEVLHHPEDAPFVCGESYQFLASYRSEAPLWYDGRLQLQQTALQGEDAAVTVIPLNGNEVQTYPLTQLRVGNDCQRVVTLTMPHEETTYPVLVRFQRGKKELQTFILYLDVVKQRGKSTHEP